MDNQIGMWWRIGKINKYFCSLITLNVMAGGGYAESYNLNVGIIAPRGVVLEKIGASSICNGACFTKARIVYHATNVEDAYLELYTPGVRENVNLYITVHTAKQGPHNYGGFGWLNANGTVPEGYLSKELNLIKNDVVELWRNSDTKVAFNEQTIKLNSGHYDFYEIYFKSATNEQYLKYGKAPKGIGIYITNALPQAGNYDIVVRRAIGYVDETHLNIQDCMYQTVGTAGRTVNNTYLIPYAIFGYKI